jgi:hypothetical protein
MTKPYDKVVDELVTKRIRLTPQEAQYFMFTLHELVEVYNALLEMNPWFDLESEDPKKTTIRDIDFVDIGHIWIWGDALMHYCHRAINRAAKKKNIIGSGRISEFYTYTEDEGLVYDDGKLRLTHHPGSEVLL